MTIQLIAQILRIHGYTVKENSISLIVSLSQEDMSTQDIYNLFNQPDRKNISSIRLLRHKDDNSFDRVLIQF